MRTAGSYGYTAAVPVDQSFFGAGSVADPWLATETVSDSITFNSFTGGIIRGIGGNFFDSDISGNFQSGNITLVATDASGPTSVTIVGATTTSFRGFVSDGAIISLVVTAVQTASSFWPTVDNLTLALAAGNSPNDMVFAGGFE